MENVALPFQRNPLGRLVGLVIDIPGGSTFHLLFSLPFPLLILNDGVLGQLIDFLFYLADISALNLLQLLTF